MKKKLTAVILSMTMTLLAAVQPAASGIDWSFLSGAETKNPSAESAEESAEAVPAAEPAAEISDALETGFASPKEAAAAYVEAFCQMDLEKMMSVCAVERYVKGFDFTKYAERMGALMSPAMQGTYLPYQDPFSYSLNCERRRAALANMIFMQYLNVMIPGYAEKEQGAPVSLKEYGSVAEAIEEKYGTGKVPEITFRGEFLSPLVFTNHYYSYMNLRNLYKRNQCYGMESSVSVAPVIYIDGMESILMLETGCYDGQWFVTDGCTLATITGLNVNSGGMLGLNIPFTDADSHEAAQMREELASVLYDSSLMSAMEHLDEAFQKVNLPVLVMTGENDQEAAETMLETTIRSAMDPDELALLESFDSIFW